MSETFCGFLFITYITFKQQRLTQSTLEAGVFIFKVSKNPVLKYIKS